jgi:hypothetical protein
MFSSLWDVLPGTINRPVLEGDPFWESYVRTHPDANIHVAILAQPYLDLVLAARKTVESRFSVDRRAPYENVLVGDVILLKQVGGPICGIARAEKVWCYRINPGIFASIRLNFGKRLQIEDPELWARYKKAAYATLIQFDNVTRIDPLRYPKRDQRAWITFKRIPSQMTLPLG